MNNLVNRSGFKDKKAEEYLDISGNIIVVLDSKGKITLLNKKGYELFGYKEGELLGKNWFKTCVPKENRKEVEKIYKKHLSGETKRVENYESPVLTKKGKKRIINWTITWLKDEKGKIREILSSGEDISLRKEAEKALEESEERFKSMFEQSADAILLANPKTRKIIDCNKATEKLLGYSKEEILSMSADQLHPRDLAKETMEKGFKKQLTGEIKTIESEILTKDKRRIPVSIGASLIKIGGKPYMQGIFRDITERKELEKQRLESNKRLQRLAQKLIIARDELKVAIETKGEFMNIAAHELRTPLQPIIGYADRLLQENNPTDWQKERLNIILDNAKRLLKLVQDLLDINKMETGIMKFSMEEVDLLAIIKEIYQSFKPAVEAKKLKFILDISETPDPIKVEGDPNRLNQVFSNFVDNAIKFTDKGAITIQVKEGKNTATVSFKDTGNGIAKKYMPQLFTKFFQADGTDKRKVGGTGLGLAICKEIVKAHKGKISAQSTQGKGSTFQVILPKLTRPTKRKGVENGQNFGSRR